MPLGTEVSLGPGPHCVEGDPAPPEKGVQPLILGPCLSWLNGWMDEDATWYGDRPRRRPCCVKWGPSSPTKWPPLFPAHDMSIVANRRPSHLLSSCLKL